MDIYTYEYSLNQVIVKYIFTTNGTGSNFYYKNDVSGNVIELKQYSDVTAANPNGNLNATLHYTYDTKNSALASLLKEFFFPVNNKNNVLTEKYNINPVYNYNWEYNDKGYPKKRTSSFTRTYEYL